MNDNAYAIGMADNLVEMAGIVFLPKESILREEDRVISLDDRDIDTIVQEDALDTPRVSGGIQ